MSSSLPRFVALDFETANSRSDSACSIGLVRVEEGKVVGELSLFIKPPSDWFQFTWLHGISWERVANEPTFGQHWKEISKFIEGVDFLAAHNAGFDRRVLLGCCEVHSIAWEEKPFLCTVRLARQAWNLFPTKLNNVCEHLGITLQHHEALSDARACAKIVIEALKIAEDPAEAVSRSVLQPPKKPKVRKPTEANLAKADAKYRTT